jgi:phosphatidylglycerol:prolipoprotein diacylglycerol transferase
MYPVLFEIGGFEITSFGVMMVLSFLSAGWILSLELARKGLERDLAWDLVFWAAVGGVVGAKLNFLAIHWRETLADPGGALTTRAGMVWYGGFVLGGLLVVWRLRRGGLSVAAFTDACAPAVALAYAVGRVGCFLVGDDYGRPTGLPWGMAFPHGSPPTRAGILRRQFGVDVPEGVPDDAVLAVHPTQLYEVGLSLLIFAYLWRTRRAERAPGQVILLYLVLAGIERFLVEFVRAKDDRVLGFLTLAQIMSLLLVGAAGAALLLRRSVRPPASTS